MAHVATYLFFKDNCAAAFAFYREAFGTEYTGPIKRYGEAPPAPGQPPLPSECAQLVMHVGLPTIGNHFLMGSDTATPFCPPVTFGSNVEISLAPDTRAETERLFRALSEGGTVKMPLAEMFWGGYYASWIDRFGVLWSVNCEATH